MGIMLFIGLVLFSGVDASGWFLICWLFYIFGHECDCTKEHVN